MIPHPETLSPSRAMLLVIDVQERIDAVMADGGHRPRIEALVDGFVTLGLPVVATEQYRKGLGPTLPGVAAKLPSPPIEKMTFSCLREPDVVEAIEATRTRQVVVTGIETHVCVLQTTLDLLHAGYQVQVPHDAINSRRVRDREWALHRLTAAGAVVTSTESVLFELLGRAGTDTFRAVSRLVRDIPVDG